MKLTCEYTLLSSRSQPKTHFDQDSVEQLINLLEGRQLFNADVGRSDKIVTNTAGQSIRKKATLPLDHPEMKDVRINGYILRDDNSDDNPESITLKNGTYRADNGNFLGQVSVTVVLNSSDKGPFSRMEQICQTIRDTYR